MRNPEFGCAVKKRVLTKFASLMHWNGRRETTLELFSEAVKQVSQSLSDQSEGLRMQLVVDGLLVEAGGMCMFSHLSFQEYLTACELADPATDPSKRQDALDRFLKGDDWWKE